MPLYIALSCEGWGLLLSAHDLHHAKAILAEGSHDTFVKLEEFRAPLVLTFSTPAMFSCQDEGPDALDIIYGAFPTDLGELPLFEPLFGDQVEEMRDAILQFAYPETFRLYQRWVDDDDRKSPNAVVQSGTDQEVLEQALKADLTAHERPPPPEDEQERRLKILDDARSAWLKANLLHFEEAQRFMLQDRLELSIHALRRLLESLEMVANAPPPGTEAN